MSKVIRASIKNAQGKVVTNLPASRFDFAHYEQSDTPKQFIGYCGSRAKVSGAIPNGGRLELHLDNGVCVSGKFLTFQNGKRHITDVSVS